MLQVAALFPRKSPQALYPANPTHPSLLVTQFHRLRSDHTRLWKHRTWFPGEITARCPPHSFPKGLFRCPGTRPFKHRGVIYSVRVPGGKANSSLEFHLPRNSDLSEHSATRAGTPCGSGGFIFIRKCCHEHAPTHAFGRFCRYF